jgi:hypothetical protein
MRRSLSTILNETAAVALFSAVFAAAAAAVYLKYHALKLFHRSQINRLTKVATRESLLIMPHDLSMVKCAHGENVHERINLKLEMRKIYFI